MCCHANTVNIVMIPAVQIHIQDPVKHLRRSFLKKIASMAFFHENIHHKYSTCYVPNKYFQCGQFLRYTSLSVTNAKGKNCENAHFTKNEVFHEGFLQ